MSRKFLISFLLLLPVAFPSCEPEDWILEVNCSDCYDFRPDSAELIVNLSINSENPYVPLTFYSESADGTVDWVDTAYSQVFYLYSKMDQTYTVKAEYRKGKDVIIAYDSDHMSLRDYGEECGDPCYIIKGGIFDLTLIE